MIRTILILIFSCTCFISQAQVNIITTIAGNGNAAYSGDGGPATSAEFNRPSAVCFDKFDNAYVTDAFNHRVRKITLTTGIVTTYAGNGVASFSGDGGNAIDAEFYVPQGVLVDDDGNVYISDGGNYRIRKVNVATNIVTTIAGNGFSGLAGDGGIAINAELGQPIGLAIKNNELLIGDYDNGVVRKLNLTTGVITRVAGNGIPGYSGDGGAAVLAQLNGVSDIFVDQSGNILVVEQWNGVVRKIDAANGAITTVVGKGTLGYSGDGGAAINAELNEPTGIFVDKHNNLYISDYRNGAIRKVDAATGIITTLAGGISGYGGDGGPATNAKLKCTDVWVDDNGNIYIADYVNNRIRKVSSGVAVTDVDKGVEAKLFPNPTTGVFSVKVPAGISLLTIYNIGGVEVLSQTITTGTAEVDLSSFPSGIYLVYVRSGDKLYVNKVMKN
ncbi:MAG: T9SS type A sorting domain-containing protein [Chitinophagaceae bacterium]|nr:T9SS type A sorting domain-containing protein [Chitinophagaceae bacterium]